MANVTTTTSNVFRATVVSKEALLARESALVLANLVKRYDRDTKGGVKAIDIGTVSNLTAVQKSADTALTFAAPTETKVTINLDQYWAVPLLIEDIAEIQSAIDLAGAYSQKAGYGIAEKIDAYIGAAMKAGFTTNVVGTFGTALSYANIRLAKLALDEAKAPATERYFAVTAKGHDDLLGIAEFTQYQLNSNSDNKNAFNSGKVGYILGMEVYMSTNLPLVAGSPDNNSCFMFHKEAYALAVQKDVSVKKDFMIEHLGDAIVASAIWGGTVLREDHGVHVRC